MASSPTNYLDPSAYVQGGGISYIKPDGTMGVWPINPNQFATGATAEQIAAQIGGTAGGAQLTPGPGGFQYVDSTGKPMDQTNVTSPSGTQMNAGLVAQDFGKYGSTPGSYGQYEIAGQGAAPPDQTYAQYALSQPGFQMDPTLGNSGPGYNYAWDPNTKSYTNTATGQTGISQDQAISTARTANGVNPQTLGVSPTSNGAPTSSIAPSSTSNATPQPSPLTSRTTGPQGVQSFGTSTTSGDQGITPLNVGAPQGTTPSIGTTSGPQGPTNQGFAPTGNAAQVAPNAQYLSTAGNGNPLSYLQYNNPTEGPFAGQYQPYTGTHIDEMAQNNRNLALGEGAGLESELQNYTNFNAGQSGAFQQQLASAYAPIASGQGGYTNEQMQAILNEPALQALQQTPGQAQANFLTEGEQGAISGDPYAAYRQLGLDEQGIDQSTQSRNDAVNGALQGQTGAVNNALNTTGQQIGGTLGEFNQNYNFGPADEQAIREQAGRTVGNQELSDEDRLAQQANQQGNVSPLALEAARGRMRQTGAVNEANAMSDAAIKAKQLALNTTATREATQQGAEQYLGNQQQQAQQFLGAANTSNAQQLGAAGTAAEEYKTGTNLGAGQAADTAASNRAAGIATNRQTTEQANQGTQLQRGQYIYGQNNATNTGFANQTLQQQQEYRNYLQNQQTQANQNQTIGNQQKLNAYGTQIGGANSATNGAISNYAAKPGDPTLPTSLFGVAKGGAFTGPQTALVGEAGPELILDFSGPDYSGRDGGSRPRHMADGGLAGLPGLEQPYEPYGGDSSQSGGGWSTATPVQTQQAAAAQAPNPGDLVSQGPTGAGAIHPKNNSLWNGIVAGLGAASGAQSGSYSGGVQSTPGGGNILTALSRVAQLGKTLGAFACGGVVRPMAHGGTVAPVTLPPPQFPDVDAGIGSAQPQDSYIMGGGGQPAQRRSGGGNPPPAVPPIIPPSGTPANPPPIDIGQSHEYVPTPAPKGGSTSTITYPEPAGISSSTIEFPPPGSAKFPEPEPPSAGGGSTSSIRYPEPPGLSSSTISYPPPGQAQFPEPPNGASDSTFTPGTQEEPTPDMSVGYKPRPLGVDPTLRAPNLRPGGLTGLGESSSTFTPTPATPPPTPTPPQGQLPPEHTGVRDLLPPTTPGLPGGGNGWTGWPGSGGNENGSGDNTSVDSTFITDPNYTPGSGYGPGSLGPSNPGEAPGGIGIPSDNTPVGAGGGGPGGDTGGMGEDDYAKGGVITSGGHPFGARGRSKSGGAGSRIGAMLGGKGPTATAPKVMPKVSLVDHPQIRTLGLHGPSAVLPLTPRKGNRLGLSDLPGLISKFSGPAYGA